MINGKIVVFDVSFYQDDDLTPYKIDFSIMKSQGGDGVIIRAGQNTWIDEDYLDYCRNADSVGFPRGAYWFYDSRTSPLAQADLFANVVEQSGFPPLGIWGDYEERYGGTYGGERNFKIFLDRLKVRFPNKLVGVYTGPFYWVEKTTVAFRGNFSGFPLWIAHYKVSSPTIPPPWGEYVFWQFTDETDGLKFGVESRELDTNIFDGSLDDYKRYFLLDNYIPVEIVEGEIGMFEVVSEQYNMSLRADRSVFATKVATVPMNTVMIADQIAPPSVGGMPGDSWAHIPSVIVSGVARSGWVAVVHNGDTYCIVTPINTTPTLPDVLYIATRDDMSDKVRYDRAV
jgi:GH25 family lysozyme M1 (1,4-beta-N-acetylmuramidase)